MSQINTNGIDANYPIPGQNNSSQGFRDNFAQIKTQFNIGANEITDLQTRVVVKSALAGTAVNNDMANTLISNASTSGFRSTTYNLGNALSGTVLVDVNRADVQYGALSGNIALQFGGWSPTNTESNVVLRFTINDPNYVISLPNACVSSNNNFGVTLLENYVDVNNVATVTAPANTEILEYTFSSLDCGNTVTVTPTNRPLKSTQIVSKTPSPTGFPGDLAGDVAVDANYIYVCTDHFDSVIYAKSVANTYASGNIIEFTNSANLGTVLNAPIIFTGNIDTANTNIVSGQVYYVKTVSSANITISASRVGGTAGSAFQVGNANVIASGGSIGSIYVGTDIWKRAELTSW